jgi:formylglycine-generating enzyme required for sulfatase activity
MSILLKIVLTGSLFFTFFSIATAETPPLPTVHRDMILLKDACYTMGSEEYIAEEPEHKVCLNGFFLDRNETTQKQFESIMEFNPSRQKGDDLPVTNVTWSEAENYCRKLKLRLPTEAEWEFAARAGGKFSYSWGWDMDDAYAWYKTNSKDKLHPVGEKKPNGFGFYDLNGNVWEWVTDWYRPEYYETVSAKEPVENPIGPFTGQHMILRGGSYADDPFFLRSASRYWYPPNIRNEGLGFRCAGNPEEVIIKTGAPK